MMRQQPGEGHHFWEQLSLTRVPVTASCRVPFPSETSFSAWPSSRMEADSMGLSYETLIRNIHRWYFESWILFMELNLDFELWYIFLYVNQIGFNINEKRKLTFNRPQAKGRNCDEKCMNLAVWFLWVCIHAPLHLSPDISPNGDCVSFLITWKDHRVWHKWLSEIINIYGIT